MRQVALGAIVLTLGSGLPLGAQWVKLRTADMPRTAGGAPDLFAPRAVAGRGYGGARAASTAPPAR